MSDIRLPNGQYSLLVTPVGKNGITQFVTPVNPDGTVVTGASSFTNGYISNGVANFTQATNPTTRIDGSALVVGDKLYRADLRRDYYWNGVSSWVSEQLFTHSIFELTGLGSATTFWSSLPHIDAIVWVEFISGTARFVPTIIGDRWDATPRFRDGGGGEPIGGLGTLSWISPDLSTYEYFSKVLVGSLLNLPANNIRSLVSEVIKTGSPGSWAGQVNIAYRLVA